MAFLKTKAPWRRPNGSDRDPFRAQRGGKGEHRHGERATAVAAAEIEQRIFLIRGQKVRDVCFDTFDEGKRVTEKKNRYYFAYGSNMDMAQMSQRCPETAFIGAGEVKGYRFIINSRGVATVVPDPLGKVYGILWDLTQRNEKTLDRYEGVKWGTYQKVEMNVKMDSGRPVSSLVYVARDDTPGKPRDDYMERILAAAKFHDLPEEYVVELESWIVGSD
jgi:cation transport regulator ChaC